MTGNSSASDTAYATAGLGALLALTFVFLTIWIVWLMQMMMGELVHLV